MFRLHRSKHKDMKKTIIKQFIMIVAIIITISSVTGSYNPIKSHAASNGNTPDYFREFRIPLRMVADPMYERIQIVRMADYIAYHSIFSIIPSDLLLIAKQEAEFIKATDPELRFIEALNRFHSSGNRE